MTRLGEDMSKPALAHVRRNEDGSYAIYELEEQLRVVDVMAQCVIARRDPKSPLRTMIDKPPAIKPYLAHVRRNDDGSFAIHELEEHLRVVGDA